MVVQVKAARNRSIVKDASFHTAFDLWFRRYDLERPMMLRIEEVDGILFWFNDSRRRLFLGIHKNKQKARNPKSKKC